MLKAYKYRIYPTVGQIKTIEQTFGCCRLVYNLALQVKITAYKDAGIRLSAFDLCHQLVEMKKYYKWLRDVDSQALQAAIKKVDISFKGFFNGKGYPKFKKKTDVKRFQSPSNKREIDWINSTLSIPKISNIPISLSRVFNGKIKTVTISKNASGKYFASILVDNNIAIPIKTEVKKETTIGIDVGLKTFAVLSTGRQFDNPKYLKNSLNRLKCLQRRSNRKKKGSNNRKKANLQVALLHEKITNQRTDFLHKFSDTITKWYDTICVEDLNVAGMIKNHNLAQAISDVGWSTGLQFIKYKSEWRGKNYVEIGRFEPSSKMHNKCGFINSCLSLSDREWICPKCNEVVQRDHNAAQNIEDIGLRILSGMGSPVEPVELSALVGAKKQEYITRYSTKDTTPTY